MVLFLLRQHYYSTKHRRLGNSGDKDLGCAGHESKLCCPPALHNPQKAPGEGTAAAPTAAAPREVLCHSAVPGTQVQMSAAERRWPHSNTRLQYSEGELRKSEAAPVFKAGACQPLPTPTLKGSSQKPVSSSFPENDFPVTVP